MRVGDEYTTHLILGDNTFSRIKTEEVIKGAKGDPIVEGTTFVHGGDLDKGNRTCMYVSDTKDYERLYSLDILGVEDRSENDPSEVYKEFIEDIQIDAQGRYELGIPWIPGNAVTESNEVQNRKRLKNIERKLEKDPALKETYQEIVTDQLNQGIIEKASEVATGERVFYLPRKPVCRENASTTKTRMVFDCSARPSPMSNSINECMYTGPALQPNLWDIWSRPEWHQTY